MAALHSQEPAGKNVHVSGRIDERVKRPPQTLLLLLPPFLPLAGSSNWSYDLPQRLTSWTLPRVGYPGNSLSALRSSSLFSSTSGLPYRTTQWGVRISCCSRAIRSAIRCFCFPTIPLVIFNRWRILSRIHYERNFWVSSPLFFLSHWSPALEILKICKEMLLNHLRSIDPSERSFKGAHWRD